MSSRHRLAAVCAAAAFVLLPALLGAAELQVTCPSSLAEMMAAASPGDLLILGCGVYQEEGIVVTPGVTLRGNSGQPGCVILETTGEQPVLIFQDAGCETKIEGLVFRLAAEAAPGTIARGGAILCRNSSPEFQRCEFRDLSASYGGAVYCGDGSSPAFLDCVFEENRALAAGGAIACVGESSPSLSFCVLARNTAGATGGAIHAAAGSQPELFSCTVAENEAATGSGLTGWDTSGSDWEKTIVALGSGGRAWAGDAVSVPQAACSDVYGNAGGDWVGALEAQAGTAGNLAADPMFCFDQRDGFYYTLEQDSPCAPKNSGCGHIGAMPIGCQSNGGAKPDGPQPIISGVKGSFPNPFNPQTKILFDVGQDGPVRLAVFDVAGRLVRELVSEPLERGAHETLWRGDDQSGRAVAAGVYFLNLKTIDSTDTRRLLLIK